MLQMNHDKVCFVIQRVRELRGEYLVDEAEMPDEEEPFDLDHEEAFDELDDNAEAEANPLREELEAFIEELLDEEQIELVALTWVGRGDFTVDEWDDAIQAATERRNDRTADYLLGIPPLGAYLEEGLDAFGLSCIDFDEWSM